MTFKNISTKQSNFEDDSKIY